MLKTGVVRAAQQQVPQAVADAINKELGELRGLLEGGSAEAIKAKIGDLQKALMKIGESLAGQSGQQPGGDASSGAGGGAEGGSGSGGTYDADVKDEKK